MHQKRTYISCISSNIYLHVINFPNERGLACDFNHRAIELPVNCGIGLPNFANFNLDTEIGSNCDSLTATNNFSTSNKFIIYPNPSEGHLKIENTKLNNANYYEIQIYDISGKLIERIKCLHIKINGIMI
ncbi:MAG: T9SS type A sorting domain-containing protein [Saprospiraceae bacterium]|nr:T9SS type A sorting domain-containing protein [Saprospiraceae bacterium]